MEIGFGGRQGEIKNYMAIARLNQVRLIRFGLKFFALCMVMEKLPI